MTTTKPINIDELLNNFGISRTILIKKNPKYKDEFAKLDRYYKRYDEMPSDSILNATNSITISYIEKLKKENPEMFVVKEEEDVEEVNVESKFTKYKNDLLFFIEQKDQSAIDDLFNAVGEKNTKFLISFDNFKPFYLALKNKDSLIVSYLAETGERLKIYPEMVMGREGEILKLIYATKNTDLINKSLEAIKDNKKAESILKKSGFTSAKIEDVSKVVVADNLPMDIPLVIRLEKKFAIRMLDSAEEISGPSKTYKFIVPNSAAKYFDAKVLFNDGNFTTYETDKSDFERQFGLSVYELGICWVNLLNMISIEDVLCIFYLANISSSLMVERDNAQLRAEYLENMKFAIQQPETNKIADQFFQIREANLINLRKSGFLDEQFCPTKMLYCAIVLHSFPFPAYTHPFEFIDINELPNMFQFKTVKGEYANDTFYTDGDVLFLNFTDTRMVKFDTALTDVARTTILNLKSNGRSDLTKKAGVINHFIPFIYSIPKSGVTIPTFSLKMLDVDGRKINWGAYEFEHEGKKFFINSYALSNVLSNFKREDYIISTYEGVLSDTIFANPNLGVIIHHGKNYLAIRGINANQFLADNFGANWEKYYKEMYSKGHLNKEVLANLDADMVKALYTSSNNLIISTETGLQYSTDKKAAKTYEKTYEKEVAKPTWQTKKDERVYITPTYAKEKFSSKLFNIFDKIKNLRGEQRDEAILDEMYNSGVDRIFPNELIYMGFGLKEYITNKPERINFKNKYKLTIPILLSFKPTYYLEKIK